MQGTITSMVPFLLICHTVEAMEIKIAASSGIFRIMKADDILFIILTILVML